ncbi:MAG: hypothetical protein ABW136_02410, partial [Steroidobacteraceae bacterium]
MKTACLFWSSALLAAAPPALTATTFKTSGSVRMRYEALSGQSRAGFRSSDQLASVRSIFAAEVDTGVFRFNAELTDSRAWLAERDSAISSNDINTLEPSQVYVAADFEGVLGA